MAAKSADEATPAISVIVPARDAEATIGRTVAALEAQDLCAPFELVVVDAGSRDSTARLAAGSGDRVRVVGAPPLGPAGARNLGVGHARAEALAFTDADCFPEPGWLAAGLEALRSAALVQGLVRPDPYTHMGPFDRSVSAAGQGGLFETANLFVTRRAFDRAGGFEEWLRPKLGPAHMAEDLLFGWKVRRASGATTFCADAIVNHAVFARGPWGYVVEHRRRRYFPDIARKAPEVRHDLFFARVFLSRRTAAFDLALVGCVAAAVRRSPAALVAALPYAWGVARGASRWGGKAPKVAAAWILADAVGCYSLLLGSLRRGTPVL